MYPCRPAGRDLLWPADGHRQSALAGGQHRAVHDASTDGRVPAVAAAAVAVVRLTDGGRGRVQAGGRGGGAAAAGGPARARGTRGAHRGRCSFRRRHPDRHRGGCRSPCAYRIARGFLALDRRDADGVRGGQLEPGRSAGSLAEQHHPFRCERDRPLGRCRLGRRALAQPVARRKAGGGVACVVTPWLPRRRPLVVALLHPGHGPACVARRSRHRSRAGYPSAALDRRRSCDRRDGARGRMDELQLSRRPAHLRLEPSRRAARAGRRVHPHAHEPGRSGLRLGRLACPLRGVGPLDVEPVPWLSPRIRAHFGSAAQQLGHRAGRLAGAAVRLRAPPA